jgi:hypothetical protein
MSEINYFKVLLCKIMWQRCGIVVYGRHNLVDDAAVDDG